MEIIVVLSTTHLTLMAEKALERGGVKHRTVMKPRRISSDCGLAIRLEAETVATAGSVLKAASLVPARFFRAVDGKWECFLEIKGGDEAVT